MRTTLSIDDDILATAKELAKIENKSVGEVISALARRALTPGTSQHRRRNGVPLLPVGSEVRRVTPRLVRQLGEELP